MGKSRILGAFVLILGAAGAYWAYGVRQARQAVPPVAMPAPPALQSVPAPPPATSAAEPAIKYPLTPVAEGPVATPLPALDQSDAHLKQALEALLGGRGVLRFLQLDGFVRRVVTTVDNLGREHAPPLAWPVNPTPGRFATLPRSGAPGGEIIDPDNARRYLPLVQFIEGVDAAQAVALYVRLYPLFQQAYEEAGFPRGYFNDRLVAVIDLLLATPVPEEPPGLTLVQVKGPVAPQRPWVRYEFSRPELEALAAGQKMLVRSGPSNQRRLQAKLREIRGLLLAAGRPAAAPVVPASLPRAD